MRRSIGYRLVAAASRVLAAVGLGILLILAFFTMMDGILRAAINQPIDLVREIGDLVAAVGAACCLPIALLERSNITLRALSGIKMPGVVRAVETFAASLVLIILIAVAWQFVSFAQKTAQAGDVTWLMNVPKAPFWFVVAGILWIAALVQLFVLFDAVSGETPPESLETAG
jgi:TRAP-type C4-dicarboxylate transport system permease small subunit